MTEKQEIYFDIFSIGSDHILVDKFIVQYSRVRLYILRKFNSFIIIPVLPRTFCIFRFIVDTL